MGVEAFAEVVKMFLKEIVGWLLNSEHTKNTESYIFNWVTSISIKWL